MFNAYYIANCAKGGIFLQMCELMGVHNVWSGAVSDTQYMDRSSNLDMQQEYVIDDLVEGKIELFHNILDKGHRIVVQCKKRVDR